jgi:hypothetical protein
MEWTVLMQDELKLIQSYQKYTVNYHNKISECNFDMHRPTIPRENAYFFGSKS